MFVFFCSKYNGFLSILQNVSEPFAISQKSHKLAAQMSLYNVNSIKCRRAHTIIDLWSIFEPCQLSIECIFNGDLMRQVTEGSFYSSQGEFRGDLS